MAYKVTIRYRNGESDSFRARSLNFSGKDLGKEAHLKELCYTSIFSGESVSFYLVPTQVAGILVEEEESPLSGTRRR